MQALLIVDHGSRRQEANNMLPFVAEICKKMKPDLIVHIAHMELAEPTIAQGFLRCVEDGASEVRVHPYMLSPGKHAMADIPNMVADAAKSHPGVAFTVSQPLGLHKKLGELIFLRSGIEYDQKES